MVQRRQAQQPPGKVRNPFTLIGSSDDRPAPNDPFNSLHRQDVQLPDGLAPGFYLLRTELLALHQADVAHIDNLNRGVVSKKQRQ